MSRYIHGTHPEEQKRLREQALFWRDELILPGLDYQAGQSLLEVGCGAGAVLAVLGQAFKGLKLTGVDLAPEQLEAARQHFAGLGLEAELLQADAGQLSLPDASFDHAFMMWFLEHLPDPIKALKEARRLLKPGGSLCSIETDYTTFELAGEPQASRDFFGAFAEEFSKHGEASCGPKVEGWMKQVGYTALQVEIKDFAWPGPCSGPMDYVLGFMLPALAGRKEINSTAEFLRQSALAEGVCLKARVHKVKAKA